MERETLEMIKLNKIVRIIYLKIIEEKSLNYNVSYYFIRFIPAIYLKIFKYNTITNLSIQYKQTQY